MHHAGRVALALNLVPFAGIAFLWFIGVLRDRLGERARTVSSRPSFFGSGLFFPPAMLFVAAAMIGAIIIVFLAHPERLLGTAFLRWRALSPTRS